MNNIEKLNKLAAGKTSKWADDADTFSENIAWLRKSGRIAINIITSLKSSGKTQKDLANMMGVTPQQISKIIKGRENLTLDTICKIEKALDTDLIEVPLIHSKQKESEEYMTYSMTFRTSFAISYSHANHSGFINGNTQKLKELV